MTNKHVNETIDTRAYANSVSTKTFAQPTSALIAGRFHLEASESTKEGVERILKQIARPAVQTDEEKKRT